MKKISKSCLAVFFVVGLYLSASASISEAEENCNECHNMKQHQHRIGVKIRDKAKGFEPSGELYQKGVFQTNEIFSCKTCHAKLANRVQRGNCSAGNYDYLRSGELLDRDSRNDLDFLGGQIRQLCNGCHSNIGEPLTVDDVSQFIAKEQFLQETVLAENTTNQTGT